MNPTKITTETVVLEYPNLVVTQQPTITEHTKDIFQQVGEKIGLFQDPNVVPVSSPEHLTGPLSEIKEVRAEMGITNSETEEKSLMERAKDTIALVGEKIEPYTEMAKETWNKAGETLYHAGESIGVIKPVQHIEGPLAEIQDVRQDMGWSKMEQPIQKPFSTRAKETWDHVGEKIEPYTEKAKETWNKAEEKIEPYTEMAKETLYHAGESIGFVKPAQNIEGPLAEIQEVRQDMGWSKMEQPIQRPFAERAKETIYQVGERVEPYTEKAKETWHKAGERIEPYTEKAKETLYEAGETLGFVKPAQNIEGPLVEIQDVRQDMGWSKMEQPIQKPLSKRAKETLNEVEAKLEPYAEKLREKFNENNLGYSQNNFPEEVVVVEKTVMTPGNVVVESSKKTLPA